MQVEPSSLCALMMTCNYMLVMTCNYMLVMTCNYMLVMTCNCTLVMACNCALVFSFSFSQPECFGAGASGTIGFAKLNCLSAIAL